MRKEIKEKWISNKITSYIFWRTIPVALFLFPPLSRTQKSRERGQAHILMICAKSLKRELVSYLSEPKAKPQVNMISVSFILKQMKYFFIIIIFDTYPLDAYLKYYFWQIVPNDKHNIRIKKKWESGTPAFKIYNL